MDHDRDEAMEELLRGREFANKLGQVLAVMKNNTNHNHDGELAAATPLFAQHLVNNILNSFTNTLHLLKKHQLKRDFSFITPTKSHEEDNSQDTSTLGGRGSYKRRKTTETWEKISESPIDDGHQWRKYGQKTILNSKYSRDYYRCTHKLDQRCEATKQVQRVEEKPTSYKTTYYGHHTCKNTDEIIFEPTSPPCCDTTSSSILLSFNNTYPTPNKQDCPFLSSHNSILYCKEEEVVVIPSPSEDEFLFSPLDYSISTSQVSSSTTSTLSPSTTLESDDDDDDDDHKDMMMMMYGLLYDSVDQLHHHDHSFHPSLGLL